LNGQKNSDSGWGFHLLTRVLMLGFLWTLLGCTQLKQYRTQYPTTGAQAPEALAIEETSNYLLGFVEFDDHGWLWDRAQMNAVLQRIRDEDAKRGLLILVFAHGWKHNAAYDDENVGSFRAVLKEMQDVENLNSAQSDPPRPPRKIVGLYLGWRGLSQKMPVLKEFTFWERKNTAHAVGQGAVSEVLVELDKIRKASRLKYKEDAAQNRRQPTMLVTVGHSFGGAVIYSAVAPFLEERLIETVDSQGQEQPPQGFGDLVVLINPAFEAARFQVLKNSSDQRSFGTNQPATLAIFTSKGDWATGLAFPAGRFVSTLFEKCRRDEPQYVPNLKAVGHYGPYITHDLNWKPGTTNEPPAKSPKVQSSKYRGHETIQQSVDTVKNVRTKVHRNRQKPRTSVTVEDSTYHFSESDLVPNKNHIAHDPIYVVHVDTRIIPNHDDFETQAFLTFLREFILAFTSSP
jgi:hypothetical protein